MSAEIVIKICSMTCLLLLLNGAQADPVSAPTTNATHDCASPAETGPCKAMFMSWNYDAASGVCVQFVYGGCEGNGNRYKSIEDCQQACSATTAAAKSATTLPASNATAVNHTGHHVGKSQMMAKDCTSPPKTGRCRGLSYGYNYDPKTGQCSKFVYGGCDGNGNRYSTQELCQQACGSAKTTGV